MKITLLHPFSPEAAGVPEEGVMNYHSQPHVKALQRLADAHNWEVQVDYFTSRRFPYSKIIGKLKWNFFPVNITINGSNKKWRKQYSNSSLRSFKSDTPDVTIINMSGHSSKFSMDVANIILKNNKVYFAMLGGQDYSDSSELREYYKNAKLIFVHTELQRKSMLQMDLFKDLDIRVFPLGVDCDLFCPDNLILRDNSFPRLLYVGRIVEWKRVHFAIDVLNLLVRNGFINSNLEIIGPISSQVYYDQLISTIKIYGLANRVQFLGHIEHKELPQYFSKSDLFLLPSDRETFGMVMIESMACGTPVAGIDCPGGPKDVIENGRDGILSMPENYAESILKLFNAPRLLDEMKIKSRQKVVEYYSIDKTVRVLAKSILEL